MWSIAKAIFIRNQRSDLRAYPWTFAFGHIIDGAYIVLISFFAYHFLIKGQLDSQFVKYTGSSNYLTFAIIGGLLSLFCISVMMNVSRSLITEWREGTLEVLLLAPASRFGYFIGTAIQQLYRCGIEFIAVLLIGILLGLSMPDANWLSALLAMILFFASCFSMALVMGSIMLYTKDTYLVQNTLFSITALVSGFQFPVQYLPLLQQWFGQIFPITESMYLLRSSLLTGESIGNHPEKVIVVLLLTVLYSFVGMYFIGRVERTLFERKMA